METTLGEEEAGREETLHTCWCLVAVSKHSCLYCLFGWWVLDTLFPPGLAVLFIHPQCKEKVVAACRSCCFHSNDSMCPAHCLVSFLEELTSKSLFTKGAFVFFPCLHNDWSMKWLISDFVLKMRALQHRLYAVNLLLMRPSVCKFPLFEITLWARSNHQVPAPGVED